ncbi:MAG: DNA primase [Oscillospiraceae bacterium]|nr:DNA primase [Oscillospiraceae bacterium]
MHANACEAARPFWFENNTLNEVAFCEDFLKKHPMLSVGGQFFSVDGRIHDEESIRKEIYEALRPFMTTGLAKRASSLLEMLRLEAYAPELPVHEDRLHLKNGTLYLDGKFTQNKEFCRNRLPVNYNPNAARPETWLRFLRELLDPEDILTLQEFMGYCLIPTTRGQTMLLIKGNGGEGKSRIGVVMQAIFGSNLKNGSIAKVERSPFARADLEHELVMVDDDMKLEALKSTHYLKSLITAEVPMDLERKGEQSYQGEMYVRFMAFSNGDLQSLYDHSDGFYRRQLILTVKKKPPEREDDPFLADKLCAETEGIFLWCLEGLKRLRRNKYRFTESSRARDNREEVRRNADNIQLFLRSEGYIRLKADCAITSAELYAIYCMWCSDNTYKPLSARTLSMTLKKHAEEFGLEHDNHISNTMGKQVNGFWGIEALIRPAAI